MSEAKEVILGNSKVHYLVSGDDSSPAVLLLHGMRFTSQTWEETKTLEFLSSNGFYAIAVDLPGFGNSDELDLEKEKIVPDLIDALKLDKPVIVAPSMSGGYTLPVIVENSELLSGYVAAAPTNIPDYADKLKGNKLPVLAIWGNNDNVVPPENQDILCNAMENSNSVLLSGAGHPSYLNETDKFHSYLLSFLKQVFK